MLLGYTAWTYCCLITRQTQTPQTQFGVQSRDRCMDMKTYEVHDFVPLWTQLAGDH